MNKKYGLTAIFGAIGSVLSFDSVLDNENSRLERVIAGVITVFSVVYALLTGYFWLNDVDE